MKSSQGFSSCFHLVFPYLPKWVFLSSPPSLPPGSLEEEEGSAIYVCLPGLKSWKEKEAEGRTSSFLSRSPLEASKDFNTINFNAGERREGKERLEERRRGEQNFTRRCLSSFLSPSSLTFSIVPGAKLTKMMRKVKKGTEGGVTMRSRRRNRVMEGEEEEGYIILSLSVVLPSSSSSIH